MSPPGSPPARVRNGPSGDKSSSGARGGRDIRERLSSMTAAPGMEIWRFARLHSLPASTCPSLSPLCNIPRAITAMLTWRSDIGKVFSHFNCSAGGSPPLRWFLFILFPLPAIRGNSHCTLWPSDPFLVRPWVPRAPLGKGEWKKPHSHPIILFLSFPHPSRAYYSDFKASAP